MLENTPSGLIMPNPILQRKRSAKSPCFFPFDFVPNESAKTKVPDGSKRLNIASCTALTCSQ